MPGFFFLQVFSMFGLFFVLVSLRLLAKYILTSVATPHWLMHAHMPARTGVHEYVYMNAYIVLLCTLRITITKIQVPLSWENFVSGSHGTQVHGSEEGAVLYFVSISSYISQLQIYHFALGGGVCTAVNVLKCVCMRKRALLLACMFVLRCTV